VNVGGKQLVEGLLRLAYTGSGLGCLHNSTIALRVIILRRERVERRKGMDEGDKSIPTLLDVQRIAQETAGGQMPKDLIQDRKKINPGCDRLNHCKRYKLP
jgi:hypothetical protein